MAWTSRALGVAGSGGSSRPASGASARTPAERVLEEWAVISRSA
ncbi:hypothetical protein [Microbispora sp. NBRC 16548]|nr:hypothetical protein [Microbispora sp. NBRC 16548]